MISTLHFIRPVYIFLLLLKLMLSGTPALASPESDQCHKRCDDAAASLKGWCGHCASHCQGGTESECVDGCKNRCKTATGEGKKDACPDGNGWKACLASCGGIKGCRNSWCDGDASERTACYSRADQEHNACLIACDAPAPRPPTPWSCLCADSTGKEFAHKAPACTSCCPKTKFKGCTRAQ